ncbi:splicing factor U2af small subunit B-like [Chenopodium quinoa]|uniref:splicing factor U2af small subunit B-like n=1 Tax=Chenopodium quinoa TaxID=63459 RepID=UPI000B7914FE|nr:splicing factor U2af small subunit B-like [Chenopodium quinoa]
MQDFYVDLFQAINKYGEIESLNICDNLADHMVGNVYVQFREEEHAAKAVRNLSGRFYAGILSYTFDRIPCTMFYAAK